MTEKTLVPLDSDGDDDRRVARRTRRERRQLALADPQTDGVVDAESEPEVPSPVLARRRPAVVTAEADPDAPGPLLARRRGAVISPDAFFLPPRAQLTTQTSNFGRFLKATFFLVVVVPTVLTALFYAFVASDQYATVSAFAVRGSSSTSSSMDLGIFGITGGSDPEISDSFILVEYMMSREMVEVLVNEANFLEVYSRPSADSYYRLDPGATVEQLVKFWQTMAATEYDLETGIITLTVRAFRSNDAEQITKKVLEKAEGLVNELSLRSREDSVKNAQRELMLAETRYSQTRQAVAAYRGDEQEIDPSATANVRQGLVGNMQSEVARLESQLTSLRATMSDNSPRVIYVRNQLDALQRQIATEKLRVAVAEEGSTQPVLTERLSRYEELLTNRDFAQKAYESTQATLENARANALKQQRYLAMIVRGSAPEEAQYPEGLRWGAILFGTLFLIWGLFALIAAAIRDRVV